MAPHDCSGQDALGSGPVASGPLKGTAAAGAQRELSPTDGGRCLAKGKGGSLCPLLSSPGDPESSVASPAIPSPQANIEVPAPVVLKSSSCSRHRTHSKAGAARKLFLFLVHSCSAKDGPQDQKKIAEG